MSSLRALIADLQEEVGVPAVVAVVRSILDQFFSEWSLPVPKVKLVNKMSARYLARCKWHQGADNTEIEVQKSVLSDPKSLHRVLAHELIHHWQFLRTDQTDAIAMAKLGLAKMDDGHGQAFMQYAQKINASMGADYVSKKSDQSYDTSKVPAFYILIQPHGSAQFGYSVAVRPSAKQKLEIEDRIKTRFAKLFKSTDGRLFVGAAPIKKYGGYVAPKNSEGDVATALRDLYTSGKEVRL